MTLEIFLSRFKTVKKTQSGWNVCCPAHDDKSPSLSITPNGKKILLHCHAGCSAESIVSALGLEMKDLFFDEPTRASRTEIEYRYENEAREHVFSVHRVDGPEGKKIWQQPAPGRVLAEVKHYPYHLPEIETAIVAGETVCIFEGEKCVDYARKVFDVAATTNSGGAGKWTDRHSEFLKGASVAIFPDNDEPGREHAEQVTQTLIKHGCKVKIVTLPGLSPKGDVCDWPGDRAELERLVAAAPYYGEEPPIWKIEELSPRRFESTPPEFEFILPDFLPRGVVGFIYGAGGAYKSLAALWLIIQRSIFVYDYGQKWLDRFSLDTGGRSIFFSAEDCEIDLHHRVHNVLSRIHEARPEIPMETLWEAVFENCLILSREQWKRDGELFLVDSNGVATKKLPEVIRLINDFGADLSIFETYSRLANVDEIDNRTAARVIGSFEEIRDQTGTTALCIAHSSKMNRGTKTDVSDQNALRGAGALLDNARWGLSIRSMERGESGRDRIGIVHSKGFRCKKSEPFTVEVDYPTFHVVQIEPKKGKTLIELESMIKVISAKSQWSFANLRSAIMEKTGKATRTAERRIDDLVTMGKLVKKSDGTYGVQL